MPWALTMDTPVRVPTEDGGTLETMRTGMSAGFWNADSSADRRGEDLGTYLYSSSSLKLQVGVLKPMWQIGRVSMVGKIFCVCVYTYIII